MTFVLSPSPPQRFSVVPIKASGFSPSLDDYSAIAQEWDAIDVDLAAVAEVADHVPVDGGFVGAAGRG